MKDNEEIKKRLDCLILLTCINESSESERLKVAVSCIGLSETARILGKDPANLHKKINLKSKKKKK